MSFTPATGQVRTLAFAPEMGKSLAEQQSSFLSINDSRYQVDDENNTGEPHLQGQNQLAYLHQPGKCPGIVFCTGFRSSMRGTKSQALWDWCIKHGHEYTCFDYLAHGESSGEWSPPYATVGQWRNDVLTILDRVTQPLSRQILVGSSMGSWLMILAALTRPDRVAGLLGIALAPDFTRCLRQDTIDANVSLSRQLEQRGYCDIPTTYDEAGCYRIYKEMLDEAESHVILDDTIISIDVPVRLLHGRQDVDVPWERSKLLFERLSGHDIKLKIIDDGDHRLSRPQDLSCICDTLEELVQIVSSLN